LTDSYLGLIVPVMVDGMVVFLLRQFFLAVPSELADAARVDGASWWVVLWRVYLPLSRPALISGALILFVTQWSAYLWPLIVVNNPSLYLAPIMLVQTSRVLAYQVDYGELFAGATVLTMLPALVVLPLQRYFVRSVATSGLSG